MTEPEKAIPKELKRRQDKMIAIADPQWVVHCLLIDLLKMFYTTHGKEPTKVHIPVGLEAIIDWHLRDTKPPPNLGDLLREQNHLMGLEVVFDADHFKLE